MGGDREGDPAPARRWPTGPPGWIRSAGVVVAYVAAYALAREFRHPSGVSLLFPPAAVTFVALSAGGLRAFWALWAGRVIAVATLGSPPGVDLPSQVILAGAVLVPYVVAAGVLRRVHPRLTTMSARVGVAAGVGVAAAAGAALAGVTFGAVLAGRWRLPTDRLITFWLGDAVAIVGVLGLVGLASRRVRHVLVPASVRGVLLAAGAGGAAAATVAANAHGLTGGVRIGALAVLPLTLVALRDGLRAAVVALPVLVGAAGVALVVGDGITPASQLAAQATVLTAAAVTLLVGAVVTDRAVAHERLAEGARQLRAVFDRLPSAVMVVGATGPVWRNRAARTLLGETTEVDDLPAVVEPVLAGGRDRSVAELTARTGAGARHLHAEVTALEMGPVRHAVVTLTDQTEARRQLDRLRHRALTDPLTGLPNRQHLLEVADDLLRRGSLGLCFIDLDGFKHVNDTWGHEAGDELLCVLARRLRETVRAGDLVARLGGDEFVVATTDLAGPADAERIADRLLAALSAPVSVRGRTVRVGASIGVAWGRGVPAADLLRDADAAMYRAKRDGQTRWACFDATIAAERRARAIIRGDLDRSLADGLVEVWYQPLVAARTRVVTGWEALLRWRHPSHGILPAGWWITEALRAGYANRLTTIVLDAVGRDTPVLHPGESGRTWINLSAHDLADDTITEEVLTRIGDGRLHADRLGVEVTEAVLLGDLDAVARRLERLREAGVRIALDDFGTGYSSITHLQRLPVDAIKLDRQLLRNVPGSPDERVVEAILAMNRVLGHTVVAEGVEVPEQAAWLTERGVDHLQGYLFGKPSPPPAGGPPAAGSGRTREVEATR